MTLHPFSTMRLTCILLCLLASITALAAPGAHGPDGEHLDIPLSSQSSATTAPRFESQTETFELVGRMRGGELTILINRFETNEPVLGATVEVESGALTAQARFDEVTGGYAIDDSALIGALAMPGEHPLVITVLAGPDADLLDGTLTVTSPAALDGQPHRHGHSHDALRDPWPWLTLLLTVALGLTWHFRRRPKAAPRATLGGTR